MSKDKNIPTKEQEKYIEKLRQIVEKLNKGKLSIEEVRELKSQYNSLCSELIEAGLDSSLFPVSQADFEKLCEIKITEIVNNQLAEILKNPVVDYGDKIRTAAEIEESLSQLNADYDRFFSLFDKKRLQYFVTNAGGLTQDEAKEFVKTHLSPKVMEEKENLVARTDAEVKSLVFNRRKLVQDHGADSEIVRIFDTRTAKQRSNLTTRIVDLHHQIEDENIILARSKRARIECKKNGVEPSDSRDVLRNMASRLRSNLKSLSPGSQHLLDRDRDPAAKRAGEVIISPSYAQSTYIKPDPTPAAKPKLIRNRFSSSSMIKDSPSSRGH